MHALYGVVLYVKGCLSVPQLASNPPQSTSDTQLTFLIAWVALGSLASCTGSDVAALTLPSSTVLSTPCTIILIQLADA